LPSEEQCLDRLPFHLESFDDHHRDLHHRFGA
jgi:hypothetical protein